MSELRELVRDELVLPVDPRVRAMAEAIAALYGASSQAVLFYGSCLRQQQLEGLMLDFYLIVSSYPAAYGKRWLALANRLIPPNVFYFEHEGLVAKYAVLSQADLVRECGQRARSTSVLARFAQPARLVYAQDEQARDAVVAAIAQCAPTLLGFTRPVTAPQQTIGNLWKAAFAHTFASELRAERSDRSAAIVDADPVRYERFGEAALQAPNSISEAVATKWWKRMRLKGKILSVVRLAKASATFAGGADYIVWKINRHSGASIELKPWQRRHPLLGAITLLPRLLKTGAVR
ncbi:hypothetical protein G7078_07180 [Sphingomonas sinipercae]|uniref:Phosphatidate cytidylyltransferase n=1 Tax=Sphingomonas sinipercae TaxID=2714944 RepID=A0A6G7ZNU2_9SPHN|nr:hypothetical protein [Sphingomonas sinipercae]QIL02592.1 hypothetical protein G7078_07180 [Sphingomonas sinipercae]